MIPAANFYESVLAESEIVKLLGRPWTASDAPTLADLVRAAQIFAARIPLRSSLPRLFSYRGEAFLVKVSSFDRVSVLDVWDGKTLACSSAGGLR